MRIEIIKEDPVPPVKEVILHLSVEEAHYLYDITNVIGGTPEGPRGLFDEIRKVLRDSLSYYSYSSKVTGSARIEPL